MTKLWNKINIHPLTYALLLISLLSGLFKYVLIAFIIVLIHELGHIIAMKAFNREIDKITILPFGGLINMSSLISSDILEDLIIAISGIGMQLVFGLIVHLLFLCKIIDCSLYANIFFYNSIIISFNLLPLNPLDGAKVIKLLNELMMPYKKTFFISFIISIFTFIFVLTTQYNLICDNLLVFIFIAISIIVEFKNKNYYCFRFYLERLNHDFHFKKNKYIKKKEDMYKNCNHIIDGISEKEYLKRHFLKAND